MADDQLKPSRSSGVRVHLDTCGRCRSQFEALETVRTTLRSLPMVEGNPLEDFQPPTFVPVGRPTLPWLGFLLGLFMGISLVFLAVQLLRPLGTPLRLASAPTEAVTRSLPTGSYLDPGETLNTLIPGDVDLEIPSQLRLRLKPGTTVTWQEINPPWLFWRKPHVVLNVMRGQVLARTEEKFWGSRLQVRTPTANAMVKGTAFSVRVEPERDATELKVLAGEVFFTPHLGSVGTTVRAGQASHIQGRQLPRSTEKLSAQERRDLLETYRIGRDPVMALVMGSGPERVEELLEPGLLFVSAEIHPELHLYMRKLILEVNGAILQGDLAAHERAVRSLELAAVRELKDVQLLVPLRLYLGACNRKLGFPLRARAHFRWVADQLAQHPLASVALGALGLTAEKDLRNPELAQAAYQRVLSSYPRSPEASRAREFFQRYSRPQ